MKRTAIAKNFAYGFVVDTVLWVLVLLLALLANYAASQPNIPIGPYYLAFGSASIIVFGLIYLWWGIFVKTKMRDSSIDIATGLAYLAIGILVWNLKSPLAIGILYVCFYAVMILRRIAWLVFSHGPRQILFSIMVFVILGSLIATIDYGEPTWNLYILSYVFVLLGVVHILAITFSRIRFGLLLKIIRRTYVAEILFGLVTLIVVFSMIFYSTDASFKTYGDALWYCFAIVTTIGFGDFTTVSTFNRIFSVILGIYGIIVVAAITSVIVNFYQESTKEGVEKKRARSSLEDMMHRNQSEQEEQPKQDKDNQ